MRSYVMKYRAFSFVRNSIPQADVVEEENKHLHFFLANPGSIMADLKKEVSHVSGCEDVLLMILQFCATRVENSHYVLMNEKHAMLRVMPYCLVLLDTDDKDIKAIMKKHKIGLDQFVRMFKVWRDLACMCVESASVCRCCPCLVICI